LGDGIYNKHSRNPGDTLHVFSDYSLRTIGVYPPCEDSKKEKRKVRLKRGNNRQVSFLRVLARDGFIKLVNENTLYPIYLLGTTAIQYLVAQG